VVQTLQSDVSVLGELLKALRSCPPKRVGSGSCYNWGTEQQLQSYTQLLKRSSSDYVPDPEHIARLIAVLEETLLSLNQEG
jgi:hypothetical protein